MAPKVLVVDDEPAITKAVKYALEQEGMTVETAAEGNTALERCLSGVFDLLVLDLMLPGLDGFSVCREIRHTSNLPILMLTARSDDIDRIVGLEIGADDYLTKPFNMRELVARVKALLRRSQSPYQPKKDQLIAGDLVLDRARRVAMVAGKTVDLTVRDFELLEVLLGEPGRVFSREELLRLAWSYDFTGDTRTVDVHVRRLREKLEPDPQRPVFLLTKWGMGYYVKS